MTGRGRERGWTRSTVMVALAVVALVEAAGCQSNDNSNDEELLALLHDDPLTTVTVGAVTATDGGVMTGVAGRSGTGSGGRSGGDAGVITGGAGWWELAQGPAERA